MYTQTRPHIMYVSILNFDELCYSFYYISGKVSSNVYLVSSQDPTVWVGHMVGCGDKSNVTELAIPSISCEN